ncbi:MAG: type II secretion system protein [Planctomycetota bacterium]|jgi:prepilin-type N-terminal cleavage/methylation domain-containing protein
MCERRGFTLVELLVVIAIIALLAAILMPILSNARSQAKAAVCLSNLQQWGLAFSMYADENNGRFFSYTRSYAGQPTIITVWIDTLQPYYKDAELCFCPMATKTATEPVYNDKKLGGKFMAWSVRDFRGYAGRYDAGSYGLNAHISIHRSSPHYWRSHTIKGAAYVPLLLDANWYGMTPDSTDGVPSYDGDVGGAAAMNSFCINRHNGHVNGVFLDYSVRKVGLKELWKLKWYRGIDTINQGPHVSGNWPEWMRDFRDY